jgi:hypothetical protein
LNGNPRRANIDESAGALEGDLRGFNDDFHPGFKVNLLCGLHIEIRAAFLVMIANGMAQAAVNFDLVILAHM